MAQILTIKRGDNKTIYIQSPDIVLTSGSIFFTLKSKAQIDPVDLTDNNGLIKKTGTIDTASTAHFDLVPADTQNLPGGTYYFDVQLVRSGVVTTIFDTTKCFLSSDVTQRVS